VSQVILAQGVEDAFEYLVDEIIVYHLDQLFFYYKGFAYEYECKGGYLDPLCNLLRRVYLDAVAFLDGQNLQHFLQMSHDGGDLYIRSFEFYKGTINGKENLPVNRPAGSIFYDLGANVHINYSNVYVRQSDLDAACEEFGIPKKTCLNGNPLIAQHEEKKKSFEEGITTINPSDSPRDLLINFTKSVLEKYPNSTTADLRRYCLEDMHNLHWRKGKIIDEILIEAGAKKSSRGKQAKKIEWKKKYPKAQWMRLF